MMTTTERDESVTTITGAAPGVIIALRRAAAVAAEHGHNYLGVEDLLAALIDDPLSPLRTHWNRQGRGALDYEELRELTRSIVPGSADQHGPTSTATVEFQVSGPHAAEFREAIERQS